MISCMYSPSISMRLSLLSAKNAIDRLSGDQKRPWARSVFANGLAEPDSNECTHNFGRPSQLATKAIFRPSRRNLERARTEGGGVLISTRISLVTMNQTVVSDVG